MDSKINNQHTDMQEFLAEDDPTGESPMLDSSVVAGLVGGMAPDDGVVDPNILALRRVDAEIRHLMESWVELENQLNGRDVEIRRLGEWSRGLEDDLRATRQELAAARSDGERLRGEAAEQRAAVESQRQQAEARTSEAERLRAELGAAQGRLDELNAEVRLGAEKTGHLTSRLAEHRDALTGLAARLMQAEKASQGLDSEKAELAARITDAEQRCAELTRRWQDSEAARRQAEKDIPAAESRARKLEDEIKAREQTIAQLRSALSGQLQKTEMAENSASRTAELLQEEKARVANLGQVEAQVATLREALAAAEGAVLAAGTERTQLLDQIAAGDAIAAELRRRIGDLEAERDQLLARAQELRDQATAVDSEFQVKRKVIAVLGSEIDRLGSIQANVRKLDGMINQQLSGKAPTPSDAEKPRNDRLIVWLDGTKAMKYPLYKPDMVIGRSKGSDIRVTGSRTSRRHAHIFVEEGAVIIEDLGSLNGIAVNDENVRRKQLHDGDVLDVGGARLRYVDLDEKAAARGSEAL